MYHSERLLRKIEACGNNTASQSIAFSEYLEENDEWGFTADANLAKIFALNNNTSSKSNYVDEMAETCGAANSKALILFLKSVDNVSTQSGMCEKIFPFMDKNENVDDIINLLEKSNSASASSAKSTWEDEGGTEVDSAVATKIQLGGFDIVSSKLARIHAALKKVGKCDQGYEWKKGTYNDNPCDKCGGNTGNGYNCAGGSHYVCMNCVKGSMSGNEGEYTSNNNLSRDKCLSILLDCNSQLESKGGKASMQELMQIQGMAMQKYGIKNSNIFTKSCEKHASIESDAEFVAAFHNFSQLGAQLMQKNLGAMGMFGNNSKTSKSQPSSFTDQAAPSQQMMGGMFGVNSMPQVGQQAQQAQNMMAGMMDGMGMPNMMGRNNGPNNGLPQQAHQAQQMMANMMGGMGMPNMMGGMGMSNMMGGMPNMGGNFDDDSDDGF